MYFCLNRGTAGSGLPLDQFVALAADAGFAGADVDLRYGREHGITALRELYLLRNLRFGGWGLPFDWRADIAKVTEGLAELAVLADIAKELGIDSCGTYILPSGDLPLMENWNFHVGRLRQVAQVLGDRGLRFGLEFCAPYHLRRKWKHEFIFTMGQMLELADAVGSNVGLLIDSYHLYAAGDTFDELAKLPAKRIVLVHINDAPAGPVTAIEDFQRLLPGKGVIDLPAFLAALRKTGYAGPVSVEVFSDELKKMSPLHAAKLAWDATKPYTVPAA
jgi:sugar phosphate isomerase/epimerase